MRRICLCISEAAVCRCSTKYILLKTLQNSQEKDCTGVSFLFRLHASSLQVFQKRCRYFPVSLMKLLRTLFLQSNCGRLLLILAFKESDKLKMCMDVRENLQTMHAKEVRICPYLPFRQKQPFADVLQNRCSYKFRNIHMKTPVLEPLFNKVAGLKAKQNLI